ncbi:hypothetical protein D3C80_2193110 [compost metagenome]
MTQLERLTLFYKYKWASKVQLQQYVGYNVITSSDYTTITGDEFPKTEPKTDDTTKK